MYIYCLNEINNLKDLNDHRVHKVSETRNVTIGRSEDSEADSIVVDDPTWRVSRKHAIIFFEDNHFYIENLSNNGTWLKNSEKDSDGNYIWNRYPKNKKVLLDNISVIRIHIYYFIVSKKQLTHNEYIDYAKKEKLLQKIVEKPTIIDTYTNRPEYLQSIFSRTIQQLKKITSCTEYNDLLKTSLEITKQFVQAKKAAIVLIDDAYKNAFTVADGLRNSHFNKKAIMYVIQNPDGNHFRENNIFCQPLIHLNELIGCLYFEDYRDLTDDDMNIVEMFSMHIAGALESVQIYETHNHSDEQLKKELREMGIVAENKEHFNLYKELEVYAKYDNFIYLIEGETGTGKELIAKYMHKKFGRKGEFIAVNCAAIPEELIESTLFGGKAGAYTGLDKDAEGFLKAADKGTIFFDEIGEMSSGFQSKMLRFFQERYFYRLGDSHNKIKVDVLIICGTNENLKLMKSEKKFREDLFYRIGMSFSTLPLREREDEIPYLVKYFIDQIYESNKEPRPKISDTTIKTFSKYNFSGNVRQLQKFIEFIYPPCSGKTIDKKTIQYYAKKYSLTTKNTLFLDQSLSLEEVKHRYLFQVLLNTPNYKVTKAIKVLGISKDSFHDNLANYLISILKKVDQDREKAAKILEIDFEVYEKIEKKVIERMNNKKMKMKKGE